MNTEFKGTPFPWNIGTTGEVMQGYSQPLAIAQSGEANLIAGVFGDVKGGYDVATANMVMIGAVGDLFNAVVFAMNDKVTITHNGEKGCFISQQAVNDLKAAIEKSLRPF